MRHTINAQRQNSRDRLLLAALSVIRAKGYSATSVDDLCAAGGVSKGAFFHHFKSKEDLAVAAAEYWSAVTGALFASAPYHGHPDPLERFVGYLEFRRSLVRGELAEFTCLVGTMVQETFDTSPEIRDACNRSIRAHAATLEADIAEAMVVHGVAGEWTAASLALHTQAVIQGAFILAKAQHQAALAADSIDHLIRYVRLLFAVRRPPGGDTATPSAPLQ